MKMEVLALATVLALGGCAAKGDTSAQANFDQACKYASGALAVAKPYIPVAQSLILARFGQDASLAFQAAISTVESACSAPLDITSAAEITQRVYDAGGKIVELFVKSQEPG